MTPRRWTFLLVVLLGVLAAAAFVAVFDFNTLRGPIERYASKTMQRPVKIGEIEVRVGLTPLVHLRGVSIANTDWAIDDGEPLLMAQAREIEFSLRLLPLLRGHVVLPQLRLTDAELALLRLADGRANFLFGPPDKPREQARPPPVEILALQVDTGRVRYRDDALRLQVRGRVQTQPDPNWPTDVRFEGRYNGSEFKGSAQTGKVLSVRNTDQTFPVRLELGVAGTTVRADGEITDIASLEHVDADFFISGPSLGTLYPTLRIALPASPPYELRGRLRKEGSRYTYSAFSGQIGGTDVSGDGEFVIKSPRPVLTATLRSKTMRIADLGPLVGVDERAAQRAARPPGISGARRGDAQAPIARPQASASAGQAAKPAPRAARPNAAAPTSAAQRAQGNAPAGGAPASAPDRPAARPLDIGPHPPPDPTPGARDAVQEGAQPPAAQPSSQRSGPQRSGLQHAGPQHSGARRSPAVPVPRPRSPLPEPEPWSHGASLPSLLYAVSTRAPVQREAPRRAPAGAPNAAADPPAATRDGRPANAAPRLLPDVDVDAERLHAIDADVRVEVSTLMLPAELAFRELVARVRLVDARLSIEPLRFRFADGEVISSLQLDGTRNPAAASLAMDMRRLSLPGLFSAVPQMQASTGRIGAQVRLKGQGLSVADLLGTATGHFALGMDGGRVSSLALATASLNGGRLLQLLVGGDELTPIRCMGMNVDFKSGIGKVSELVFDTDRVVVYGDGLVNLQLEVFETTLRPQPKEAGILSVRAPVRVHGSFRKVDLQVDKSAALRGGAALALGLVNPLAALLPLIETGPGEDSDCREVLAPVQKAAGQATNGSKATPQPDAPRSAPTK